MLVTKVSTSIKNCVIGNVLFNLTHCMIPMYGMLGHSIHKVTVLQTRIVLLVMYFCNLTHCMIPILGVSVNLKFSKTLDHS